VGRPSNNANGGRCGYGAATAKSPGSRVKLTFRLNVIVHTTSWMRGKPLFMARERRRVTLWLETAIYPGLAPESTNKYR
jgi:hypothetical protein